MSFHEVQFPSKIAYGASGGPMFNTSIATTNSGFEQRNINWNTARSSWDISTGIKSERDMSEVLAFFRARYGKAYGFRFKDFSDYKALNQTLATANGTNNKFKLYKNYKSGSGYYARRIHKPVKDTLRLYVNGSISNSHTLDTTTGEITFNLPPRKGSIIKADFEFDVPVRFDIDQIIVRATGPNQFTCDAITLIEIKV